MYGNCDDIFLFLPNATSAPGCSNTASAKKIAPPLKNMQLFLQLSQPEGLAFFKLKSHIFVVESINNSFQ
jgi:hypothetical protein